MKAKAYMKKTALTFLLALSLFAGQTETAPGIPAPLPAGA